MNRLAYFMSGYALKSLSGFSKTRIRIHGQDNIPDGSVIFTANHFTRIETIFLPYHIHGLIRKPVLSLAHADLFTGPLAGILQAMGALSTRDPDRDAIIVKSLISGESAWIIFPEGMMVKNKKIMSEDSFQLLGDDEVHKPHTGAATLALRNEFYRERLRRMQSICPDEYRRLLKTLDIKEPDKVLGIGTWIVPVNITYYPVRARENMISSIAQRLVDNPSQRLMDELMTEGTMVLSGVDVDIRFGPAIGIHDYLNNSFIESDLTSRRSIKFGFQMSSRPVLREMSFSIMQQYMTMVYDMTTLNYDHIFASILKYIPHSTSGICEYDFRCRVFLGTLKSMQETRIFRHHQFDENQIHLLTDDRYNRYRDFIRAAQSTGIVEIKDGRIFKNPERFESPVGFHAIRIENPVAVMANEIEPLEEIQIIMKALAEKSSEIIAQEVQDLLLEKASKDFRCDYNTFYLSHETKPRRIGEPIFLKSDNRSSGILLIHGYMAAPAEMRSFAEYLHTLGYTVFVPRLKGHGTSPEDLAGVHYDQWIESVEEGYAILKHQCSTLFVGGFSTGAGLALDLATRVTGIQAVFAVAPPMKLKDFSSRFVPAVDLWNQVMKMAKLGSVSKEFVANSPENPDINYLRNPIAGVHQLEKFMDSLEEKLETIDVPVLIVQSRNDPVVNPQGTASLFKKLGSRKKEYFLFDYNRHGILVGSDTQRVYKAIGDFIIESETSAHAVIVVETETDSNVTQLSPSLSV
ncbi:MAG: alpha/beta fold hydrolase [Pseudomonadota bacterium]